MPSCCPDWEPVDFLYFHTGQVIRLTSVRASTPIASMASILPIQLRHKAAMTELCPSLNEMLRNRSICQFETPTDRKYVTFRNACVFTVDSVFKLGMAHYIVYDGPS